MFLHVREHMYTYRSGCICSQLGLCTHFYTHTPTPRCTRTDHTPVHMQPVVLTLRTCLMFALGWWIQSICDLSSVKSPVCALLCSLLSPRP